MSENHAHASREGLSARLLTGAIGGLMLVGPGVSAVAPTAWTAPINISPASQWSTEPQVAVDGNGNSVLTWAVQTGSSFVVKARTLSAAGVRGPVKTLSTATSGGGFMYPDVAVDNAGDTVFAWLRPVSSGRVLVEARTMSPTGVLGPVKGLTTPGWSAQYVLAAIDSSGKAVINWKEGNLTPGQPDEDMARTLSPGGVLGPPAQLYVWPVGCQCPPPDVAVTPAGNAVFTWVGENGQTQAQTMSPTGALGPPQTISPPNPATSDDTPQAAIDPNGNAVLIWDSYNITTDVTQIQTRRLSASQALGPLKVVASVPAGTVQDRFPQVAVGADGTATLAWLGDDSSSHRIMARTLSTANLLGAVKKVSALNPYSWDSWGEYDYLGLDGTGNATIVWYAAPGVQARTLSAAGVLGATKTLGQNDDPQVAVNAAGKAVATWANYTQIQAAIGP